MLTSSITHVLQSTLQYALLILALLLYQWVKEEYMYLRRGQRKRTHRSRRTLAEKRLRILYQWIRDLRKKRGLTQERMAERFGVDPRTIQRWESGETRPQPRHYNLFQRLRLHAKDVDGSFYDDRQLTATDTGESFLDEVIKVFAQYVMVPFFFWFIVVLPAIMVLNVSVRIKYILAIVAFVLVILHRIVKLLLSKRKSRDQWAFEQRYTVFRDYSVNKLPNPLSNITVYLTITAVMYLILHYWLHLM